MMNLKEKVAIVTGGSGEIGKAISLALAGQGAKVAVHYMGNELAAKKTIDEITASGNTAMGVRADITDVKEVESMAEKVYEQWGRIDVLVNNAGILHDALLFSMEEDDWRSVIDVNLNGMFHCTKAVAKYMVMQKQGAIINMSSVAGQWNTKGHANYAASKGGVEAFTRATAIELAPKGIRVNAVAPGIIISKMTSLIRNVAGKKVLEVVPLKRFGTTDEVGKVVSFLASDESSYITGEIIRVAGGLGVGI